MVVDAFGEAYRGTKQPPARVIGRANELPLYPTRTAPAVQEYKLHSW